jgi:HAD superfamily hydrolase (TIGR01509 family)
MDERTWTAMLLQARDGRCTDSLLQRIIDRKAELFSTSTAGQKPMLFPGVADFVKAARVSYRLAIASGGRRHQIDHALAGTLIDRDFEVIVAAEDFPVGKPDPAVYEITLARLNSVVPPSPFLSASDCLVIEDSVAGIRSARQAGMYVLAVASTYPAEKLGEADAILPTLSHSTPETAIKMLAGIGHESRFKSPRLI